MNNFPNTKIQFTFQYGSINTRVCIITTESCLDLHSNMVLLIQPPPPNRSVTFHPFTFQYGSINTSCSLRKTSPFLKFTFQYGSINTEQYEMISAKDVHLHSNMVLLILHQACDFLLYIENLHSNMVLLIPVFPL